MRISDWSSDVCSSDLYVHRIGRTGRAGNTGEAIAFFSPDEERYLLDIEKLIKTTIPRGQFALPAAPRRAPASSSGRSERRSYASGTSSSKPVDDFFSKPYVQIGRAHV